jgi:hypothetical protein
MSYANLEIEVDVRKVGTDQEDEVAALSVEQLLLIAGGECVVNSI